MISPAGNQSSPSASCTRKLTRLANPYSSTLPACDSDSTSFSSTIAGISTITCAVVGVATSFALPPLSSERFNSGAKRGAPARLTQTDENASQGGTREWNPHDASAPNRTTVPGRLSHDIDKKAGNHD